MWDLGPINMVKKGHYIYLIKKTARLNVLLLNFGVKVDIQVTGNELFGFDSVVNLPGNRWNKNETKQKNEN